MAEWITDRLPTEADADSDGDVLVKTGDGSVHFGAHAHFTVVVPGQPWWSRNTAAQPTPPPAPTPARVVTAMAANEMRLFATCNDGTIWAQGPLGDAWEQLPSIPQPEAHDA